VDNYDIVERVEMGQMASMFFNKGQLPLLRPLLSFRVLFVFLQVLVLLLFLLLLVLLVLLLLLVLFLHVLVLLHLVVVVFPLNAFFARCCNLTANI